MEINVNHSNFFSPEFSENSGELPKELRRKPTYTTIDVTLPQLLRLIGIEWVCTIEPYKHLSIESGERVNPSPFL